MDDYPVCRVWEETRLVVRRQNRMLASGASLLQAAIASLLSKEAGETLRKTLKGLTDD